MSSKPGTAHVPTLLVGGEWDQEDIYGALAVYRALYAKPANRDNLYLALEPWFHGEEAGPGTHLGAINFGSDTSQYFVKHVLLPFLAQHLQTSGPDAHLPYVTGANHWKQLPRWPACPGSCRIEDKPLYLQADHGLAFREPQAAAGNGNSALYDQYVSDRATPVPYRPRPVPPAETKTWPEWLVGDQRPASSRPDVETYETPILNEAVQVTGRRVHSLLGNHAHERHQN